MFFYNSHFRPQISSNDSTPYTPQQNGVAERKNSGSRTYQQDISPLLRPLKHYFWIGGKKKEPFTNTITIQQFKEREL